MLYEALLVHKRGRWVTVAKIVKLDDEPILAMAVRHQRGTSRAISLPLPVVAHAESRGCRWFYRRDDRAGTMGRIALADMRQRGWIGSDGELYVKLTDLEPTPWKKWAYAKSEMRIGPQPNPEPQQRRLALGV
jgi:hypothetical protein